MTATADKRLDIDAMIAMTMMMMMVMMLVVFATMAYDESDCDA